LIQEVEQAATRLAAENGAEITDAFWDFVES
jgi:hypothetical protein